MKRQSERDRLKREWARFLLGLRLRSLAYLIIGRVNDGSGKKA